MNNQSTIANPAPLGLIGFGMTTILLNLHNAGLIQLSIAIIAMGIAMGGIAQIIAGIMEFKSGNTFGATAFTAYGFFWISLVIIWTLPVSNKADSISMGYYLLIWGIFTACMFVSALTHNTITKIVFGSLTLLFLLLALGDFTEIHTIKVLAGYVGIFCGCSALYSAMGQVINAEHKKVLIKL